MIALVVDDQYDGKAKLVTRVLEKIGGIEIVYVSCSRDAIKEMKARQFSLLVLDLQIPSALGQDVDPEGGKQLLEYVEINDALYKPERVLGITAHNDSFKDSVDFFSARGWALLLDPSEDELNSLLTAQLMCRNGSENHSFDIAIITALEHVELEAVLALPYSWKSFRLRNDITSYYSGEVTLKDGQKKSVLACSSPRMGMAAAAVLATKVSEKFSPTFLVMTGVAAAVRGEAEIGDILIADPCWDWGSGKLTVRDGKATFLSDPSQIPLNPSLASK